MKSTIDLQPDIKPRYFSDEQLASIKLNHVPHHIAFIPDGNRRWAETQNAKSQQGHQEGGETLIEIIKAARELNVKVVTFYLFSTENWGRPQEEINALMWLLYNFLIEQRKTLIDYGVKVGTIGQLCSLPEYVQEAINESKEQTAHCCDIDFVMALNYGSRNEICRAVQAIASDCANKKLSIDSINESMVAKYLDTASWPDPDLLIRTSGEMRVSNYLLWQISYTEIYSCQVLWPDFQPHHLLQAIINFQKRQRRLGRL